MLVGYMRVSTNGDRQVLDLQRDALLAAGVDARHLFEDRITGNRVVASSIRGGNHEIGVLRPKNCPGRRVLERRPIGRTLYRGL
jgi:Resolvase, N terminal domain